VRDDRRTQKKGGSVAPIVESIEISRRPEDVFAYVTDPAHQAEWQESLVSAREQGGRPLGVGTHVTQVRRVGRGERTVTIEWTEYGPPRSFAFRGIDGPIRAVGKSAIEPLADRTRSRLTTELDFEGHGVGKLLVRRVRSRARTELPRNHQRLKELLESSPT
jgi:uncharacterized protein YndB with AHSA1/START domain